jgi:hypothetical protein
MKLVVVFASIVLALLTTHGARASELGSPAKKVGKETEKDPGLMIQVVAGEWGDAKPEEIKSLLDAVAAELLTHFPGRRLDPIVVSPTRQGPVVLYQKSPKNEYQIYLAAKDKRWAEYVYEFSHELFHILVNYEYHAPPRSARHQWFEETLCETVSLYTLKRLSLTWEQSPPRAEWASYARSLNGYTKAVLTEQHRRLPENTSLAQWFQENGPVLLDHPYLREKNELVANLFLPLLEQNPDWRAAGFLNLDVPQSETSFHDYLANWYGQTPMEQREFIRHAMKIFQFETPATTKANLAKVELQPELQTPVANHASTDVEPAGASGPTRQ